MRIHTPFILLACTAVLCVCNVAAAEPARFWLSASPGGPTDPQVPTVRGMVGMTQRVDIWGRPATLSSGPYHPSQNPYKTLQNVSLNVVADSAEIGFLGGSPNVYNPQLNAAARRFEFTHDAASGLDASSCPPGVNGICGLQGFSISPTGGFAGMGPACHPNDPFCTTAANGNPAWLIGSVEFQALQTDAEANLRLQLGMNGINHVGESSLLTNVVFGTDSSAVYRAGRDTDADGLVDDHDRNITLPGDGPDLIVTSTSAMLAGDYNGNSQVEQGDLDLVLLNWGDFASIPPAGWINDLPLGFIDQAELDGVLLNWGNQSARLAVGAIPEPSGRLLAVLLVLSLLATRRLPS